MNGNGDLSCDGQLLVKQVTAEQQLASTSHRKKKCRGNRKEQHARRRRLQKRDMDETTTVSRMDTITETELTTTNTQATDEPGDSMTTADEGVSQV